jgi:hypothetical protein
MKHLTQILLATFMLTSHLGTAQAEEDQIIIEDLPPSELRAQIERIQTEFYRVFNTLNDDDNLDIVCHIYTPTGSNINKEACEPQFVIDKRSQNASDAQRNMDVLLTPQSLNADLTNEFEQLTEAMNAVSASSDYFKELNLILGVLRERLEEITS